MTAQRARTPLGSVSLLLTRVLLGALALLPFLPLLCGGVPRLTALASAVDGWFSFQCQRDPARALWLFGQPLPVCARCAGIYWGIGLGALIGWPRVSARQLRAWLLGASLFMGLDIATELLGLRPAWAPLRVLSGLALAYPVGVALLGAARARFVDDRSRSEAVHDAE